MKFALLSGSWLKRNRNRERFVLLAVVPLAEARRGRWGYNQIQVSATELAQAIDTRTGREFPEPVRWLEQILGCTQYSSLGGKLGTACLTPTG
jgi:hypothetical protein